MSKDLSQIKWDSLDFLVKTRKEGKRIIILLWNLCDEIMEQLAYAKDWGAKFVVTVPKMFVY